VTPGRKVRILLACHDRPQCATINRLVEGELPAEIREAANGPDAFDLALAWLPDLFVLAAELHGFDGLQLCHRLRGVAAFQDTPVIVLGPRGDQKRKYQAFYVGATDYVEVPFDGVEFVFRLRAPLRGLLRQPEAPSVAVGGLTLEPATRTARVDGREAVLTPSEYAVLRVLAANAGTPMTVERLPPGRLHAQRLIACRAARRARATVSGRRSRPMMRIEPWRYHANRWQTWVAIAVVVAWILLYALASARHPMLQASSGYWPDNSAYSIPFQGGTWRMTNPNVAVDVPASQMVLLGEHDGVKFYGRPGDRLGGGGGYGGPLYQRIYVQAGDGKFIPLERVPADPNAGRFMR